MDGNARLSVDQGDVVRDDVVELARDPDPLGSHPLLCLLFTGSLRVLGPFLDSRHIGAA